jgi:hypothetical protein
MHSRIQSGSIQSNNDKSLDQIAAGLNDKSQDSNSLNIYIKGTLDNSQNARYGHKSELSREKRATNQ